MEGLQHLRSARNSFSHEGRAVIGKEKVEVTEAMAADLIVKAKGIVKWVEELLPTDLRRPVNLEHIQISLTKDIHRDRLPGLPPDTTQEGT